MISLIMDIGNAQEGCSTLCFFSSKNHRGLQLENFVIDIPSAWLQWANCFFQLISFVKTFKRFFKWSILEIVETFPSLENLWKFRSVLLFQWQVMDMDIHLFSLVTSYGHPPSNSMTVMDTVAFFSAINCEDFDIKAKIKV